MNVKKKQKTKKKKKKFRNFSHFQDKNNGATTIMKQQQWNAYLNVQQGFQSPNLCQMTLLRQSF